MDFDLNDLDFSPDDKPNENSIIADVVKSAELRVRQELQQRLGYVPKQVGRSVYVGRGSASIRCNANDYQHRRDAILFMFQHSDIAAHRWPLREAFRVLGYTYKRALLTSDVGKQDQEYLSDKLKQINISVRGKKRVQAYIAEAQKHHLIAAREATNQQSYTFEYNADDDAVIVGDTRVTYSTDKRAYTIMVGGERVTIPKAGLHKVMAALQILGDS